MGLVRADQKDFKAAILFYDQAINLNPQNGDFFYNKGSF